MKFCSFASGSSGNCEYIGSDKTNILVDAGISNKRIEEGLKSINLIPNDIDGILITHEHSDHISGIYVFASKNSIPIYATGETLKFIEMNDKKRKIDTSLFNVIEPDKEYLINDITFTPFSSYHDAYDPVCYTLQSGGVKIGMATDLGKYDNYILSNLKDSDMLFIEANYDVSMLQVGKYPFYLKRRILGDRGHLSNDLSAKLILELIHSKLKNVFLAHISKENNYPELAYETVKCVLNEEYGDISAFNIETAARNTMSCRVTI